MEKKKENHKLGLVFASIIATISSGVMLFFLYTSLKMMKNIIAVPTEDWTIKFLYLTLLITTILGWIVYYWVIPFWGSCIEDLIEAYKKVK